jgi:protein-disulfide isomerase
VTMKLLVAAAAIAASLVSVAGSSAHVGALPPGAAQVASMLRGIPQRGVELGPRSARVTLVEFADLQCPYCAQWESKTLPVIVRKYVRTGKVRLVFAGMAFVGSDSEKALRTALAAGLQNRFWNVLELLYLNQGRENAGWVTDSLVRSIGGAVPGLNVSRMLAARSGAAVDAQLKTAANLAVHARIQGTPSFAAGRTGQSLSVLSVNALDAKPIESILDELLRG